MLKFKGLEGFTLIEVLIAFAIIGIFCVAGASHFTHRSKSDKNLRTLDSRAKIIDTIQTVGLMPSSIRNSAERSGNEALKDCLISSAVFVLDVNVPGDCISGKRQPLHLYGPVVGSAGALVSTSGSIGGTPLQPARFNTLGSPCEPSTTSTTSKDCIFEVITEFSPQCPPGLMGGAPAATCDVAELIEVFYSIRMLSSSGSSAIPGIDSGEVLTGYLLSSVKEITGTKPSIYPEIIPPPPPAGSVAATAAAGPASAGSGPPDPPPKPIHCVGSTVQTGPNSCECPTGMTLINLKTGACSSMSV